MNEASPTVIAGTPYDLLPEELLAELTAAGLDPRAIHEAIVAALAEDLPADGPGVDVTSDATIPADLRGDADLAAREDGVVAGLAIAELVFVHVLGGDVEITDRVPDGTRVRAGDVVMRASGPVRGLLTAERTALELRVPPVRGGHGDRRLGRGARRHPRTRARHPQDAAGLPRAAEVRRPLRRRRQPPLQSQ